MEPATSPLVVHNASEEEVAANPMIDVNSSMQGMHAEKNIEEMVASDGGGGRRKEDGYLQKDYSRAW